MRTALKILLLIESTVLAIALITPLTPSKTGGKVRLGEYFFDEPTYFHEVLVNLVMLNLIVAVLAIVFAVYVSRSSGGD